MKKPPSYYFADADGEVSGPLPEPDLRAMFRQGLLPTHTLVRREDWRAWRAANSTRLAPAARAASIARALLLAVAIIVAVLILLLELLIAPRYFYGHFFICLITAACAQVRRRPKAGFLLAVYLGPLAIPAAFLLAQPPERFGR